MYPASELNAKLDHMLYAYLLTSTATLAALAWFSVCSLNSTVTHEGLAAGKTVYFCIRNVENYCRRAIPSQVAKRFNLFLLVTYNSYSSSFLSPLHYHFITEA